MGTSHKTHDISAVKSISRIGIAPYDLDVFSRERLESAATILDKYLDELLNDSGFVSVIKRSVFLEDIKQSFYVNERQVLVVGEKMGLDGILFCKLTVAPQEKIFGKQTWNAAVHLRLMKPKTRRLVVESSHNTALGNSYWIGPNFEEAIHDAVYGAMMPLVKELLPRGRPSQSIDF